MSTTFNRETLKVIQNDLQEALRVVGGQHGINITLSPIRFTEATFSAKIDAHNDGEPGDSKYVRDFKLYGQDLGFDLGDLFEHAGKLYAVAGYRPRARLAIIGNRSDNGKQYAFDVDTVKRDRLTPALARWGRGKGKRA